MVMRIITSRHCQKNWYSTSSVLASINRPGGRSQSWCWTPLQDQSHCTSALRSWNLWRALNSSGKTWTNSLWQRTTPSYDYCSSTRKRCTCQETSRNWLTGSRSSLLAWHLRCQHSRINCLCRIFCNIAFRTPCRCWNSSSMRMSSAKIIWCKFPC